MSANVIQVAPSPDTKITRSDLISKKEDIQVNALKELYDSYENKTSMRNKKQQAFLKRVSLVHIPIAVISFTMIYC